VWRPSRKELLPSPVASDQKEGEEKGRGGGEMSLGKKGRGETPVGPKRGRSTSTRIGRGEGVILFCSPNSKEVFSISQGMTIILEKPAPGLALPNSEKQRK